MLHTMEAGPNAAARADLTNESVNGASMLQTMEAGPNAAAWDWTRESVKETSILHEALKETSILYHMEDLQPVAWVWMNASVKGDGKEFFLWIEYFQKVLFLLAIVFLPWILFFSLDCVWSKFFSCCLVQD